ncbi:MAG: NAD(P)-binding domain-containing protein [Bacteroidaceae bacterium]|nr:NAD(P)-binding domain-containing protein [Bacteroidaceae bacterium]
MKISIIGAGAMGGAIAEGLLKVHDFDNAGLCVADASKEVLKRFADRGIRTTTDNHAAVQGADVVMVVVKPWITERVLLQIKDALQYDRQMLVVVAAGITSGQINGWLEKDGQPALPPYFLVIPNIGISELSSMTFIVPVKASDAQTACISGLFDKMGSSLVTEERLLGAGTTLASCGIAYALRYIRAAVEGGVELGFKAQDAQRIVSQTVKGAVELLQATGAHPESLIDQVTTPGGVTIKGLNEMEHAGFSSAVIRGLKAGAK